jgi:hypothetical protein
MLQQQAEAGFRCRLNAAKHRDAWQRVGCDSSRILVDCRQLRKRKYAQGSSDDDHSGKTRHDSASYLPILHTISFFTFVRIPALTAD